MDNMDFDESDYDKDRHFDQLCSDKLALTERIAELEAKVDRLTSRGIEDMHFTISEQDAEIKELRKRNEMLDAALAGNCSFAERMEAENVRLQKKTQAVYDAGISGIGYVGAANYAHRESEAKQRLHDAMYGDTAGESQNE